MAQGKKRPQKERDECMFFLACGDTPEEVSAKTGVPRKTVADWLYKWRDTAEFKELRRKNANELEGKLMRIQQQSLSLIEKKLDDALKGKEQMGAQTANIIYGTAFDKLQIMRGGNTANIGVQGIEDLLKAVSSDKEF